MLAGLEGTYKYFKIPSRIEKPSVENTIFRLHYQLTFGILAVAVVLVTGYQYIDTAGSAIQCMMDKGTQIPSDVINNYCWIMSTYSLPKYYEGIPGKDVIAFGVGPHDGAALDPITLSRGESDEEQIYHAYYQWVPLFLSFQAFMFYLPHFIWKTFDGKRFQTIVEGLNKYEYKKEDMDDLVTYMKSRMNKDFAYEHKMWAMKLYFCELLNFINVVAQISLTDRFLGGAFSNYGLAAASWSNQEDESRVDPMYMVFPRMTKCMFHKFGVSGTIEKFDALCVLGMNIINEKIFVFLWFWYVVLAILSGLVLIERVVELFVPSLRVRLIEIQQFGIQNGRFSGPSQQEDKVQKLLKCMSYSDWMMVYCLSKCMEANAFNTLIKELDVGQAGKANTEMKSEGHVVNMRDDEEKKILLEDNKSDADDDSVADSASDHGRKVDRSETLRSHAPLKHQMNMD